jgi:predicted small integral membrane protein
VISQATRVHRPLVLPYGLGYLLLAGALALFWIPLRDADVNTVGLMSLAIAGGTLVSYALRRRQVNGRFILEPPVLVAAVFFVWHFAFWMVYYAGLATDYRILEYFRFSPSATNAAFLASTTAMLALVGGIEAATGGARPRSGPESARAPRGLWAIAAAGCLLVVSYFVLQGHTVIGQYSAVFLQETGVRRLYNLGVLLTLASAGPVLFAESHSRRRAQFIALAVPVLVISLAMGTRWIVFSFVLIALCARSMRGDRIPLAWIAVALVALVTVGIVTKELRAGDLTSVSDVQTALVDRYTNPLFELPEELGQAFIPVAGSVQLSEYGQTLLYGRSYADAALSVVPSLSSILHIELVRPGEQLAAAFYTSRNAFEGFTIGYSPVAELYTNFGILGVLLGMAFFGYLFGWLYRRGLRSNRPGDAYLTFAVTAVLLFGLRNDAATSLRYAVWGILIVYAIGRIASRTRTADRPRAQPV